MLWKVLFLMLIMKVTLNEEDTENFKKLYKMLDDIDDVTEIYHNVDIEM